MQDQRNALDVKHQAMTTESEKLKNTTTPKGLPFALTKLGHVVLQVTDIERSVHFYTQILGFKVSDVYPDDMVPGKMVFMRCNADHHCIALVGAAPHPAENIELHHIAFEVATLDEVLRAREHLRVHEVPIDFQGRRRAGSQIAVEFRDPDNHSLEIFWGLDQVGSDGITRPPSHWNWVHSIEAAIADPVPGQDTTLREG